MPKTARSLALALGLSATAALAHEGVQNPAVMARMDGMSAIGDATKLLGRMAKGETPFEAEAARGAAATIADHAAEVPALFEAPEDDPKSEAKPLIWQDYADFTDKAGALEAAAADAAGSIAAAEDLRPALAAIGETCKACHERYRE